MAKKFYLVLAAGLLAAQGLFAGGQFFAYRSFWPETAAMRAFGNAGIDLYAVMPSNSFNTLGEPYCKFPPFWVWDETYLWNVVDEQFDLVINQNPRAKFICMIDINSPLWLARRLDRKYGLGGDSYHEPSNSLCIKEWRELTEKMLVAYVKHMEERYGDRVVSYMIAGGGTSEWYCCSKGHACEQKEEAWARWLKEKNLPGWDLPSRKRIRNPAFEKLYFDPATQRDVIEYARFTEELISQGMERFSKIARDIVGEKKQIGAFCGFIPMQFSGKLDNRMTYNSKTVNFIGSPGGYSTRDLGLGGGTGSPIVSLKLRGKHWFQEIDHRTHTYNPDLTPYVKIGGIHEHGGARDQADTNAILKREFSLAAVLQNSLWCFDMWGGVFSTPETMALVKKAHEIWLAHKDDNIPTSAEIAMVIDPQSGMYVNYLHTFAVRKELSRMGAPYEEIFFDDIANVDFSKYKLVVFPHSFEITPAKKKILEDRVFKNGKTVITMLPFGACDGETIDTKRVERLTGFPYAKKGIFEKQMDGWKSVYAPKCGISPDRYRKLAKEAGVHIYVDENVPVYANEKLVAVHVKDGGKKTISLPCKAKKIVELFTGKTVAENADKFEYDFASPDTALFEISK